MQTKLHLLSFSSKGYQSPQRFLEQANTSGYFETIEIWGEAEVSDLIKRHRITFWVWKKRGFGFWVWKPYVILKRLNQLPEGEILIYADQGMHIVPGARAKLESYLLEMLEQDSWIGVFGAGSAYAPDSFVKSWAIRKYLPNFSGIDFGEYVMAGLLIIRNSRASRAAIADWLFLCESRLVLQPLPIESIYRKRRGFIGQDGDNGFLPLVLSKLEKYTVFRAEEINLINDQGLQLAHVLPRADYDTLDWSELSTNPFQYRRDR